MINRTLNVNKDESRLSQYLRGTHLNAFFIKEISCFKACLILVKNEVFMLKACFYNH